MTGRGRPERTVRGARRAELQPELRREARDQRGAPGQAERRRERSQHFIRRGALATKLVEQAALGADDLVVEIGAGTGALTRELARRCGRLIAVEIDGRLCRDLRDEFACTARVEIVRADFLEWSRAELPVGPFKAFGNLPFRGSAAIVRRLVQASPPPDDAWLVLQRESAERFAGRPWTSESLASLRLKPWWQIEITSRLRPVDFAPPPSVEASLLWLARRHRPLVDASQAALYRDFLAAAFASGRGSLGKGLATLFTRRQLRRLADELHFRPHLPPTALGFEQWLALFRWFAHTADPTQRARVRGAHSRLPR